MDASASRTSRSRDSPNGRVASTRRSLSSSATCSGARRSARPICASGWRLAWRTDGGCGLPIPSTPTASSRRRHAPAAPGPSVPPRGRLPSRLQPALPVGGGRTARADPGGRGHRTCLPDGWDRGGAGPLRLQPRQHRARHRRLRRRRRAHGDVRGVARTPAGAPGAGRPPGPGPARLFPHLAGLRVPRPLAARAALLRLLRIELPGHRLLGAHRRLPVRDDPGAGPEVAAGSRGLGAREPSLYGPLPIQ